MFDVIKLKLKLKLHADASDVDDDNSYIDNEQDWQLDEDKVCDDISHDDYAKLILPAPPVVTTSLILSNILFGDPLQSICIVLKSIGCG